MGRLLATPPAPTERNTTTPALLRLLSILMDFFFRLEPGRRWWSSGKIPAGPKRRSIVVQKRNKIKTREISVKGKYRKKKKLLERLDGDPRGAPESLISPLSYPQGAHRLFPVTHDASIFHADVSSLIFTAHDDRRRVTTALHVYCMCCCCCCTLTFFHTQTHNSGVSLEGSHHHKGEESTNRFESFKNFFGQSTRRFWLLCCCCFCCCCCWDRRLLFVLIRRWKLTQFAIPISSRDCENKRYSPRPIIQLSPPTTTTENEIIFREGINRKVNRDFHQRPCDYFHLPACFQVGGGNI